MTKLVSNQHELPAHCKHCIGAIRDGFLRDAAATPLVLVLAPRRTRFAGGGPCLRGEVAGSGEEDEERSECDNEGDRGAPPRVRFASLRAVSGARPSLGIRIRGMNCFRTRGRVSGWCGDSSCARFHSSGEYSNGLPPVDHVLTSSCVVAENVLRALS